MCSEEGPHGHVRTGWPSASQEQGSHRKPSPATLRSGTCSLQNCKKQCPALWDAALAAQDRRRVLRALEEAAVMFLLIPERGIEPPVPYSCRVGPGPPVGTGRPAKLSGIVPPSDGLGWGLLELVCSLHASPSLVCVSALGRQRAEPPSIGTCAHSSPSDFSGHAVPLEKQQSRTWCLP